MPAPRKNLRPVSSDEVAPPVTVAGAAKQNDSRAMLGRTREIVAAQIDNPETLQRDLAALVLKLVVLDEKIRAMDEAAAQAKSVAEEQHEREDVAGDVSFSLSAI